jgi:hypothetical protein
MPKLRLDVEALEVQSFLTADERTRAPGTVEGYDSHRTETLTHCVSCLETCAETCDGYTCGGWTCFGDTCDYTCHTNVCACELSDFGSCIC